MTNDLTLSIDISDYMSVCPSDYLSVCLSVSALSGDAFKKNGPLFNEFSGITERPIIVSVGR